MPDVKVREEIFKLRIGGHEKLTDADYKTLAQLTEGYKYISKWNPSEPKI